MTPDDRVQRIDRLRRQIADKLDEITALYSEPVKVTLVVRAPAYPDGRRDTVMTDDDPEKAIAALRALYGDSHAEVYPADTRIQGSAGDRHD